MSLRWDYGGTRGTWLCMLPVSRELGAENVWVEEEKSKFERAWNQSRMPTREIRKTNRTSIERNEKEEKKRNENWGWPVREMKMRHSSCCNKNVADLLLRKRIMTSAYNTHTHAVVLFVVVNWVNQVDCVFCPAPRAGNAIASAAKTTRTPVTIGRGN
jgi:hypothetical protein